MKKYMVELCCRYLITDFEII